MIRTILAASDLSARSDSALGRAIRLAREHGARLIVAHIVDDAPPPEICSDQDAAARASLTRFLDALAQGVEVEIHVACGDPTADLLALIADRDPDLLVLGTHRPRPFLDALRETTAARLVRLSACPVLVVRDREDIDYAHIVAATDFSPVSGVAIGLAASLAPGTAITPVHAFHVPWTGVTTPGREDEMTRSFRLEAVEADARWRAATPLPDACGATVIRAGIVAQVLAEELTRTSARLIAAGAHGRVGQARALLGSVATDLLRAPPCDVLIARPH